MSSTPEFDHYAEQYDQLMEESLGFLTSDLSYFAHYKVRLLQDWLEHPPRHLLDFGCGIGRNLGLFREAFPSATLHGADVSACSLARAAEQHPDVHWHHLQCDTLPVAQFDIVFLAGVVHHIPAAQRDTVFRQIRNSMAADGRLFIFEHNPLNPITRRVVDRCAFDDDEELVRKGTLEQLLGEAGFTIWRSRFVLFSPPFLHRHLHRLEAALGWCPLGGQYVICAKPSP